MQWRWVFLTHVVVFGSLWINGEGFQRVKSLKSLHLPSSSRVSHRITVRPASLPAMDTASALQITSHHMVTAAAAKKLKSLAIFSLCLYSTLQLLGISLDIPKPITKSVNLTYPYSIFINGRSGGKEGRLLLSRLSSLVAAESICDLSIDDPQSKLQHVQCQTSAGNLTGPGDNHKSSPSQVAFCCGGDGTVQWVMDAAKKANVTAHTAFAVVPMGTGNDLFNHLVDRYLRDSFISRVVRALLSPSTLVNDPATALQLYSQLSSDHLCRFDRWKLTIESMKRANQSQASVFDSLNSTSISTDDTTKSEKLKKLLQTVKSKFLATAILVFPSKRSVQVNQFNNYFGIGIDGDITFSFHMLRKQQPHLFFHRLVNKVWYAIVWLYRAFTARHKSISDNIELFCDGQLVDLQGKRLSGIILTNINSYAGGSKLWTFGSPWKELSSDDGIIEVVGLTHLVHLATFKGGFAKPIPLAQGRSIKIISKSTFPMQIDGEPMIHGPCIMDVRPLESVQVLLPSISSDNWKS